MIQRWMVLGRKGRLRAPDKILGLIEGKKENKNENGLKVFMEEYGDEDKLLEEFEDDSESVIDKGDSVESLDDLF